MTVPFSHEARKNFFNFDAYDHRSVRHPVLTVGIERIEYQGEHGTQCLSHQIINP